MEIIKTKIEGVLLIKPSVFKDSRGYFFESYNRESFKKHGLDYQFIQDNQSYSSYGVIRGLHFQKGEHAQAKLVRVLKGKVLDVAVDTRPGSPTYGEHVAVELSDENFLQLLIPRGLAHGFSVLSETALFFYKCDNFYNKESEGGIVYNDPDLNIDWQIPQEKAEIADKDQKAPSFREYSAHLNSPS